VIAGFVAERKGYGAGFILLTIVALLALAFFWVTMPETGNLNHKVLNRG
jgi:predicted MFS family arabinose efflux permease